MSLKQVIYFGLVWPKHSFSAASVRTIGLLQSFINQGCQIHYFCPQKMPQKDDEDFDLPMYDSINLHQISQIEDYENIIRNIQKAGKHFDVAVFDTYIAEEKFSHFIHRISPNCMKVLDLQDLHSFREQRTEQVIGETTKNHMSDNKIDYSLPEKSILKPEVLNHQNKLHSNTYGRELASIMRSDMVITCSDYEKRYLENKYNLKNIELLTFFYPVQDLVKKNMKKSFERRKHFVWIGNHYHPPNYDSLKIMTETIWPQIQEKLPEAQLHIYGSKYNKEISECKTPGVRPMGLMKSLTRLQNYKALLAPLRFGGGIKGKITDSWANYLPVVTTGIGSEGLYNESCYESSQYQDINSNAVFYKEQLTKATQQNIINTQKVNQLYDSYKYDNIQGPDNIHEIQQKMENLSFGGYCSSFTTTEFAENAIKLYQDEQIWNEKLDIGLDTIKKRMSFKRNDLIFKVKLNDYQLNLIKMRENNHMYNITWSETLKSTENFAKYINQKRRFKAGNFKIKK